MVNYYKIFTTIYPEYTQYRTGNRKTEAYRQFMEEFVDEIFQYTDETLETFPEKPSKKAEFISRPPGRPSLARSRSELPVTPVSERLPPLEDHKHEKLGKRSYCIGCGFTRRIIDQNNPDRSSKNRARGANTEWKCTVCGPVCKGSSCWEYVHSRAFMGLKRKYSEIS